MRPQQSEAVILGLDHVQVAIPQEGEQQATAFYGDVLGLVKIAKPETLASRGGAWYRCGVQELHLGLTDDFQPQRKGHPALLITDLAAMRARLEAARAPIAFDAPIPGYDRFFTTDPFGNRLEFLQRVATTSGQGDAAAIKARVQAAFGPAAEGYVTSATHRAGPDLAQLVEWTAPQLTDVALDVSTGGGHTALALAPHVARVVASDLTPRMLATARSFITQQGVQNVEYVISDAEALPFLDATFDLVTVRIAPHHYADVAQATGEMARVLKPGGRLMLIDNIAPEDPQLDAAINAWDKRRDPSHVREYTVNEWLALLANAGLSVTRYATDRRTHEFAPWVERMRLPAAERASLEADMLAAPPTVRDYFAVVAQDGRVIAFTSDFLLALAIKPAS
ncbi:MAG: methyltransferase domain-containing protein [Ktedonobacterales bacterium]